MRRKTDSGVAVYFGIVACMLSLALTALVLDSLQIARVTRGLQRQADAISLAVASQLKPSATSGGTPPTPTADNYLEPQLKAWLSAKRAGMTIQGKNPISRAVGADLYPAISQPVKLPDANGRSQCISPTNPCFDALGKDPLDQQHVARQSKADLEFNYEPGYYITTNTYPYAYNEWTVQSASNSMKVTIERGYYDSNTGKFYSLEGAICASADGTLRFPDADQLWNASEGANDFDKVGSFEAYYKRLLNRSDICNPYTSFNPDKSVSGVYKNTTDGGNPYNRDAGYSNAAGKLYLPTLAVCCDKNDVYDQTINQANADPYKRARCNGAGNVHRACSPSFNPGLGPFSNAKWYVFEVANAARATVTIDKVPTILQSFLAIFGTIGSSFTESISRTAVAAPDTIQ